jgi:hypothetical protein
VSDPKLTNEKRILTLHPKLRTKVRKVLEGLKARGYQPLVASAYRSPEEQLRIYRQGRSTVRFSYHCAQEKGQPAALAADIVDARYLWNVPQDHAFWKALGHLARAQGLVWGGDWRTFPDVAHLQLLPNEKLSAVRTATQKRRPLPL